MAWRRPYHGHPNRRSVPYGRLMEGTPGHRRCAHHTKAGSRTAKSAGLDRRRSGKAHQLPFLRIRRCRTGCCGHVCRRGHQRSPSGSAVQCFLQKHQLCAFFVDACESKTILAWANIAQIDGAHNANATAREAWKVMPELIVQHAINSLFSEKVGMDPKTSACRRFRPRRLRHPACSWTCLMLWLFGDSVKNTRCEPR
jgi:hypothetical protein